VIQLIVSFHGLPDNVRPRSSLVLFGKDSILWPGWQV